MARPPTPLAPPPRPASTAAAPNEALQAWERVQAPLCRMLLDAGIDYPRAAAALRQVFLEQAHRQMLRNGAPDTDSGLSLLSGVHRKEVRQWRQQAPQHAPARAIAPSAQLFARWSSVTAYRDRRHRPKAIPRLGPAPSFEALAREVTQDVHPFTLLQELLRLGLVALETRDGVEYVLPRSEGFVPRGDLQQLLDLFGMNLADHAAAAVSNLAQEAPRLEQSVFADGLSQASMNRLAELARELWAHNRDRMVAEALRCLESDASDREARGRVRFGAYFWNEAHPPEPAPDPRAAAASGPRRRKASPQPPKERL